MQSPTLLAFLNKENYSRWLATIHSFSFCSDLPGGRRQQATETDTASRNSPAELSNSRNLMPTKKRFQYFQSLIMFIFRQASSKNASKLLLFYHKN